MTWWNTTTTEHAANIRKELKAKHGWTSRDVSVKSDCYSMGSAIRITIKNPAVAIAKVKAIAEPSESIRRDEATGEILSGGNRYVDVNYSSEALDAIAARYVEPVVAAERELRALVEKSGALYRIGSTKFFLGFDNCERLSVWDESSFLTCVYDAREAARFVGVRSVR